MPVCRCARGQCKGMIRTVNPSTTICMPSVFRVCAKRPRPAARVKSKCSQCLQRREGARREIKGHSFYSKSSSITPALTLRFQHRSPCPSLVHPIPYRTPFPASVWPRPTESNIRARPVVQWRWRQIAKAHDTLHHSVHAVFHVRNVPALRQNQAMMMMPCGNVV